jgi:hypothetical protein
MKNIGKQLPRKTQKPTELVQFDFTQISSRLTVNNNLVVVYQQQGVQVCNTSHNRTTRILENFRYHVHFSAIDSEGIK